MHTFTGATVTKSSVFISPVGGLNIVAEGCITEWPSEGARSMLFWLESRFDSCNKEIEAIIFTDKLWPNTRRLGRYIMASGGGIEAAT